jgi:hypothetical protein
MRRDALDAEADPNYQAYESYATNPEWTHKYGGQTVAFVDGKFVGANRDRDSLVAQLRQGFPKKDRFVTHIPPSNEEIDLAGLIDWE